MNGLHMVYTECTWYEFCFLSKLESDAIRAHLGLKFWYFQILTYLLIYHFFTIHLVTFCKKLTFVNQKISTIGN